jgi:hypothetical protein
MDFEYWGDGEIDDRPPDPKQEQAREVLEGFFEDDPQRVYFSRQIEVLHEAYWYHWITNRALRELVGNGVIRSEARALKNSGPIHLMWHRKYRYFKRDAQRVVDLVEEYANPNISGALGIQGELLVLEGFAQRQFVLRGRHTREFEDRRWEESEHELDFIFERDGVGYGVEVKNMLGYMDHDELELKIRLCGQLGVKPVFVARMLPKSWIKEIVDAGGFALVLKYQLYPVTHLDLARRVNQELGLPVDAPRALAMGTVDRFVRWHEHRV